MQSTLLHEMCHAAAWIVDGVHKPPHGGCFKKWANLAMKKMPGISVTTTHSYEIAYKYAWACTSPNCGAVIKRHSRSVDVTKHCCGTCHGKLIEIEVPGSSSASKSSFGYTPKKKREATGFSLFVKQHSKEVRSELLRQRQRSSSSVAVKVTQPEVMKECSRLWKEYKHKDSTDNTTIRASEEIVGSKIDEIGRSLNNEVDAIGRQLFDLSMG
mmetsp:Transcript_34196/g.50068  ORF Transcript_34196/g.50068 Transcript_34196/m.50068 type:complete len:213 (-) Transcript_34196:223-861(-)